MAGQQKVQPGKLIVRQVGGTDGTHEVQISHDGSKSIIESKLGELQVSSNLVVTGSTTLSTSLNGLLKASSGVVSDSANLDDLGDVIITTPMLNQILKYNGTNWIN